MTLKKSLKLPLLFAAVFALSFASCSDPASSNSSNLNAAQHNGNYWGTWSLMGSDYPMWVGITTNKFSWAAGGYGSGTTVYDFIKWTTDENGNSVIKGYPTQERYDADNPAATVTFTSNQILFDVPSMKNNAHVSGYTSAVLSSGGAYDNRYEGYAAYWGNYTGTLTVMASDYDITVTVSNGSLQYGSSMMSGTYSNTKWTSETSGRKVTKWSLSGYADDDSNQQNAKVIFEVDLSGTSPAYKFTVNVAAMGKPSAELTKQ